MPISALLSAALVLARRVCFGLCSLGSTSVVCLQSVDSPPTDCHLNALNLFCSFIGACSNGIPQHNLHLRAACQSRFSSCGLAALKSRSASMSHNYEYLCSFGMRPSYRLFSLRLFVHSGCLLISALGEHVSKGITCH